MYQFIAYIKFLFTSTNHHGVHSPFIFNFVTKCIYDKTKHGEYSDIREYRSKLLQNNKHIKVKDFGAGSKVFKSNNRVVKAIAKTSGSTLNQAYLLSRTVKYFKPNNTLELGTSLGMATYALALANPINQITSIEGCPNTAAFAEENMNHLRLKNVKIKVGQFKKVIPELSAPKFDMIFFDGHHSKKATLDYFEMLLPKVHNDTVFIFDDIYWSKEMSVTWNHLKAHPKVTVTVDCFDLGFVFFRREQAKEHFKIRL